MGAFIHSSIALAIRIAEKEYDKKRTEAAAQLLHAMRVAQAAVEHYEEKTK